MFIASTGPILATETIRHINAAIVADGGNLFRKHLRETLPLAEDAYHQDTDPFRSHLGASLIGRDCPRELWYSFHWATHPKDIPEYHEGPCQGAGCLQCIERKGRMQRLYNRGHLEEPRFVALLRMIGCRVWQFDENGRQFRVSYHDGHFGGSLDSVVEGCPDDPSQPLLGEYKTHKADSFSKLLREGVRSSKFTHFIQMQIYMGGLGLRRALYLAVNKDTDELYGELVWFDQEQFNRYYERAWNLLGYTDPPKKVNESPGWFTCRFCDHRINCHMDGIPHRNCRTCRNSRPGEAGLWYCYKDGNPTALDKPSQLAACDSYERRF